MSACSGDVNDPVSSPTGSGGFSGKGGVIDDGDGSGGVIDDGDGSGGRGYGGSVLSGGTNGYGGYASGGKGGGGGYAGNQPELDCQASAPTNGEPALVAQYNFDEPSGAEVLDTTELALAGGTIYGATRGEGHSGGAVTFSAPDARIELQEFGNVFCNGIDLEIWISPTAIQTGEAHLIGDGGGGVQSFQLVLANGYPLFRIVDGEAGPWRELLLSASAVQVGVWQKLRVTYDGDVGQMFVDDVETASVSLISPVQGSYNTIFVGALRDYETEGFMNDFAGSIDELSVWRYPAD